MATAQEIEKSIAAQRASIAEAQVQAQALGKREEISRAELQRRGLMDFARRKAYEQRKRQASRQQLQRIGAQQKAFEKEVAQKAPQYATQQYKEAAYKTAKQDIFGRLSKVQSSLSSAEASLARVKKAGRDTSRYERRVGELRAEQKVYSSALAGSRESLITGHFSGYTKGKASYEARDVRASYKRHEAERAFAKQQGFSSYSALQKAIKAQKLAPVISQAKVVQAPGTYDPSTGTYISPEGYGMSMLPGYEPPAGTKIIGAPPTKLPAIFQPGYVSPELRKILPPEMIQKIEKQQLETQRYKDIGYTSTEAQRLATASLARGGFTFTPEEARKIARVTISEKVPGALRDVGAYIGKLPKKVYREVIPRVVTAIEKAPPILEREIAPVILGVGPIGVRAPTGVTYGEILAAPVKAVEYVAEEVGETAELGYAIATGYLPEKWKPSKYVGPPGERPITPVEVTEALETGWFEKAEKEGWYTPITPEEVGEVVEKVVEIAPYATPAAIPYIASEFFKGVETVKHPEKEAEKIFKEQELYKAYEEQYKEAERTLEEGYELEPKLTRTELKAEYLPFITEQVKQKGAIEAVTSLAFLGAIGLAKAVPKVIETTIPRQKYLGMTQKQYQAAVKEAEKELVKLGKQDIAWIGKVEKDTGGVFIRGKQKWKGLERDIKVYGELKETELGKVFIPYGKGEVTGVGEILLGKKKVPYQYLEAQKFEVAADAITIRAGELIGSPKLIKKIPSKIKLLRESGLIPEKMKPMFVRAEEALAKEIKVIPEALAKAETFEILGATVTVPKAGAFALYKIKPKYLTPSAKLERAIKKQMKENIYFGGEITKEILPQVAIKLKPEKFLVIGRKEAGLFFVKEAKREVEYGMKIVGGVKTPFAKTFAEVIQKPVLIRMPKVPKPPKPTVEIIKPTPLEEVPLMVGGLGLRVLPEPSYAPVEVEIGALLMPPVVKPVVIPGVDVTVKPKVEVISVLRTGEKFKYETDLKLKRVTIPKFKEVLVTREALRERLISREALTLKQIQIQREALRQVPIMRPSVVPRIRPPRLRIPRIIIPLKLKGVVVKRVPKLRKPVPERGYTFEIRRKGKWQRAKLPFAFATEAGAEAIAQEKVLKEAAASYKVVKAKVGKRVVRTRKKPSLYRKVLFRKGKEPGVMVQKKKLRILTPGEKREISYAGGIARMKKSKLLFSQPKRIAKRKKATKKKKGGKK